MINKVIFTIFILAIQTPCVADESQVLTEVRLWQNVNLSGSEITLGKIAGITGNDTIVARLRSLSISSKSNSVRSWQAAQQIADAGFDVSKIYITGAARCRISINKNAASNVRKTEQSFSIASESRRIAPSSLEAGIRKLICENLKKKDLPVENRIKITFNPVVRDVLSLTEPPFRFTIIPQNKNTNFVGLVGLKVSIYRNNQLVKIVPILAQISLEAKVLVTKRKINSKALISKNDVTWSWKKLNRIRNKLVIKESDLLENRAKRVIPEGAILTANLLEPVPLVKRGQLVTAVYNKSGLEIKTVGKALKTGLKGEIIPVRNERSKNVFRGKVIGTARVLVESDSGNTDLYKLAVGSER